ncbi:stalk domain-containing protein [Schinkia sp. CFF1]
MRNYKQFVAGVIVGGVLLSGGNVLANSAGLPSVMNWVKYKINGEAKALPSGYTTLNYEGHTYVPTRFIADQLGADVKWDDQTKTVTIEKPVTNTEPVVNNQDENTNKTEECTKPDTTRYEELPVSKMINGVRVELDSIENDQNYTKLYVVVKNTNETLVQLNQGTASFKSEFDTYANKDINGGVLYWKDTSWFKDIGEDQDSKGYIMLPPIPKDERQGKFYVEVYENGLNQKVTPYEFDIKW